MKVIISKENKMKNSDFVWIIKDIEDILKETLSEVLAGKIDSVDIKLSENEVFKIKNSKIESDSKTIEDLREQGFLEKDIENLEKKLKKTRERTGKDKYKYFIEFIFQDYSKEELNILYDINIYYNDNDTPEAIIQELKNI